VIFLASSACSATEISILVRVANLALAGFPLPGTIFINQDLAKQITDLRCKLSYKSALWQKVLFGQTRVIEYMKISMCEYSLGLI